jgi:competence protein ComEC
LILAFAAGAAYLQTRPDLPDLRWLWLALPVAAGLGLIHERGWGTWLRHGVLVLLALSSGFFYAAWRAEVRLADRLPAAWEGRDIVLSARVAGLPEATPRGWRLLLEVATVDTPGAQVPHRVQISLFDFSGEKLDAPRGSDCIRLTARLGRPRGSVNFGGFDYEGWLLERDIRAQGYAVAGFHPAHSCGFALPVFIDRWREAMRQRLNDDLAGKPYAGIITGLAIGDQAAISDSQWNLFRDTGVTHLMSISGLHVTLLAGLVFFVVDRSWRRLGFLVRRLPARQAASLAGFLVAAWYVAMTGFGLPAQRTLYMVGAAALALWLGRVESPSRVLAAALALVVLIDPWAALSPGFWLSFGAVAILLYTGSGRLGRRPAWREWVEAQWAVTLALTPGLLYLFHGVSLVSPLANAFAIPLISLVVVPLVLAAALLPAPWLAELAHAVIAAVMAGLQWLAALPQPVWHGPVPGLTALVLALIGTLVLLLPRGLPGRWLGAVMFLPLVFPAQERLKEGEFRLDMLDVGQGLALVVRTGGHVLSYDAGPRYASGEDAGARVVAPFLHGIGVNRLDAMVVSHQDADHSGGALSLIASHNPVWRLASFPLPGAQRCLAGQRWRWDGVDFEMLHPAARYYDLPGFSDNDLSCVLRVSSPYGSVLMTGDIARLGELSLIDAGPGALHADLLSVPHHGSGGSSMSPFIAAVRPTLALISVGYRNRFGHPAPEALARYRAASVPVERTDHSGGLQFLFVADGLEERSARAQERRYWYTD